MAYDLEEQEQLENLKDWWKRWSNTIVVGASLAIIAASGFLWWKKYQARASVEALAVYENLLQGAATGNAKVVRDTAAVLIDKFGGTPYAAFGGLVVARVNNDGGDANSAKAQLTWVADHAKDPGIAALAKLRLSGIYLDEKKYDEATKLLSERLPEEFAAAAMDLRGDVLVAQGKKAEARAEFTKARDALEADNAWRKILEFKLDGLGDSQ
jgi:predicted negative regulator of RcsB-dependent stress response